MEKCHAEPCVSDEIRTRRRPNSASDSPIFLPIDPAPSANSGHYFAALLASTPFGLARRFSSHLMMLPSCTCLLASSKFLK